ncbi:InlB B-repeat-containing protein [Bacillus sp. RG28]|uniref:InlB B-repeat-containing protein n=1 Tax=Gottfriedia endophytica TaxID=2820819 RepID=A0A940NI28_9BACI|nr:GH25 family lysozyme [Gottfriedia endophytica]MBP0725784.1 InlB B-repeat-containing protein [Gottfriedia endophytica]
MKHAAKWMRSFISVVLLISVLLTSHSVAWASGVMPPATSANLKGIDVSKWQGTIDWKQVKNSGIAFVYAKASQGTTYTDPMFSTNVQGARAAGLPIGAYHYASPSAPYSPDDAKAEAQYFVNVMTNGGMGDFGDIMPVLDLEQPATTGTLTSDEIASWARVFTDTVKSLTNRRVMVYTGAWFVQQYNDFGGKLSDLPVWIARYGITQPPAVGGWTQWTAWQYDQGTVPGISGNVDLDYGPMSIDSLRGNLTYKVVFKDADGTVLSTEQIGYGSAANPPVNPERTGYTFTGWDINFSNVTSDLVVTAQYKINQYKVVFMDSDGKVLDTQTVAYGSSASVPQNPSKDGYTFLQWDQAFNKITSDLTVKAIYEPKIYTIIFKDYNGTILSDSKVKYNMPITAPAHPNRTGYTFTGWDQKFTNATSDLTITALYKINQYPVIFKNDDGNVLSTQTVNYGAKPSSVKAPVRTGYTFVGWFKSSKDTVPYNLQTPIKFAVVLSARYAKNTTVPGWVKVTSAGYSKVKVTWRAVSGAQGYEIFRATTKTGTYSYLATSSSSYTNSSLVTNRAYYYKVRAFRVVNGTKVDSSFSTIVSGTPVLAAPTGLKAARASSTSIKLTWNRGTEASGYEIFRATSYKGVYTKVVTLTSGSTLSFTNTKLSKGKLYYFKIRAYRTVNGKKIYSGYSNTVYLKTY